FLSSLLSAIKMDLGYCELFRVDGKLIYKPKSISFGKMDEAAFDRAVDLEKLCFPHDTPNG
ncbi:hypothetical protein, partial [uncultured Fretibacterium sp.]|uniref:hypothetical protein n=1 Tax=uncultured Fretibacterium sp. TaxID=1678694 RepID=UPI0026309386